MTRPDPSSSILSFPERGQGGDARYRGNCSPQVYEWLIRESGARSLLDPCIGGGTSIDVALALGLRACGSDLSRSAYHQRLQQRLTARGAVVHLGVDARTADLRGLFGPVDLSVAHPAYGTQIDYAAGKGDMSALGDGEDFLQALEGMLHGMREATREGGHYVFIIGDTRRDGQYFSYQAALIEMARHELRKVSIKAQHNVSSAGKQYGHIPFGRISHEYVVIFRREGQLYAMLQQVGKTQRERQQGTWKTIVLRALARLGGEAALADLYDAVLHDAPERVRRSPHYQAKVRQTLQLCRETENVELGRWRLTPAA